MIPIPWIANPLMLAYLVSLGVLLVLAGALVAGLGYGLLQLVRWWRCTR